MSPSRRRQNLQRRQAPLVFIFTLLVLVLGLIGVRPLHAAPDPARLAIVADGTSDDRTRRPDREPDLRQGVGSPATFATLAPQRRPLVRPELWPEPWPELWPELWPRHLRFTGQMPARSPDTRPLSFGPNIAAPSDSARLISLGRWLSAGQIGSVAVQPIAPQPPTQGVAAARRVAAPSPATAEQQRPIAPVQPGGDEAFFLRLATIAAHLDCLAVPGHDGLC